MAVAKSETQKRTVTVDTPFESVLKYDRDGELLVFESEPGKFKELSEDEVQQLSLFNKGSYRVSTEQYRKALREAEFPSFMGNAEVFQAGTATQRLKVEGGRPGMHQYWAAPREFRQKLREGYKVVSDDSVETFASRVGTTHTVGDKGVEELILMEIPQERFDEMQRPARELSRMRAHGGGIENSARAEMEAAGGNAMQFEENDGRGPWSEVEPPQD